MVLSTKHTLYQVISLILLYRKKAHNFFSPEKLLFDFHGAPLLFKYSLRLLSIWTDQRCSRSVPVDVERIVGNVLLNTA